VATTTLLEVAPYCGSVFASFGTILVFFVDLSVLYVLEVLLNLFMSTV